MKAKELRQKSKAELEILIRENQRKLCQLNFDLASKKIKNTNELGALKKQIAQILTIIKEVNQK